MLPCNAFFLRAAFEISNDRQVVLEIALDVAAVLPRQSFLPIKEAALKSPASFKHVPVGS
jgi:hypothetical protein